MGEHLFCKQGVARSTRVVSTNAISSVWLERLFYTQKVSGSNPLWRTSLRSLE